MAQNIYLKFKDKPISESSKKKNRRRKRIISKILFFIPKGNPEFQEKIDDVTEWELEIDGENNWPTREIGLDKSGKVICIMPLRNNLGFWVDSDMKLDDFLDRFDPTPIEMTEFNSKWESFLKNNN